MRIRELSIDGAFVVEPEIHDDERGAFLEWFRSDRFREQTGHRLLVEQANCSVSAAATIRGIHFAEVPPGQAKYVTCPSGAAVDVVVDLRRGSPTFGRYEMVGLDEERRRAVYLPEGLGHAFMALADHTVVTYLCSTAYDPEHEHGINPLDPAIGIAWPTSDRDGRAMRPRLSPRDEAAPSLDEAGRRGLLPDLEQTRALLRSRRDQA